MNEKIPVMVNGKTVGQVQPIVGDWNATVDAAVAAYAAGRGVRRIVHRPWNAININVGGAR